MKKTLKSVIAVMLLCIFVSCASLGNTFFAGTVGGIYLTSEDYTTQTSEINDSYSEFKPALWMYAKTYKSLKPDTVRGNKVVFYSDLGDDADFDNALVPADFRATSMEDAGFIIITEETEGAFYNEYASSSGTKFKVYKGAAVLKLYSIKTGELLYTSEKINGPEPPAQITIYGNPSKVTYEPPKNAAFASKIKQICSKIASGKISGSVPDVQAMNEAGVEVKEPKNTKPASLIGTWTAKYEDETFSYKFTDRGFAVFESSYEGVSNFIEIIPFSYNDSVITLDSEDWEYKVNGKNLTFELYSDDLVFKQTSKKVTVSDDLSKLYGVWTEKNAYSSIVLGLAKNGFSIFYGTSRGISDWEAHDNVITFDEDYGYDYRFWIVDDDLYIADEGFFGEYEILRFKRKTSGGKDQTSLSVLTSGEWDYVANPELIDETDPSEIFGNSFKFNSNGKFTDVPFHGSKREAQTTGTYEFNNHIINLSDGRDLTFAYIDGVAIGYSF